MQCEMNRHMALYMSAAQKGISRETRGAKHLLLVVMAVARDCRARCTKLCTAWIDCLEALRAIAQVIIKCGIYQCESLSPLTRMATYVNYEIG